MFANLSLSGSGRKVWWGERLFEAGRLLTFSAFRMGAYSRWALIRGWALIRINTVAGCLGADTFNYHNLWVAYWINCSKITNLLRWLSDNGHKNLELLIHMCGLDFLKDIRFFPLHNPLEQLCVRPLHLQFWQGDVVSQRQKRVFEDLKACAL